MAVAFDRCRTKPRNLLLISQLEVCKEFKSPDRAVVIWAYRKARRPVPQAFPQITGVRIRVSERDSGAES